MSHSSGKPIGVILQTIFSTSFIIGSIILYTNTIRSIGFSFDWSYIGMAMTFPVVLGSFASIGASIKYEKHAIDTYTSVINQNVPPTPQPEKREDKQAGLA
jgi:hypothetical protein